MELPKVVAICPLHYGVRYVGVIDKALMWEWAIVRLPDMVVVARGQCPTKRIAEKIAVVRSSSEAMESHFRSR